MTSAAAKRLGISQPTYLPWLGYFELMDRADEWVVLDTVQLERHSWQHRNRIKGPNGEILLVVPVGRPAGLDTRILEAEVIEPRALRRHLRSIEQAYAKAPHALPLLESLEPVLTSPPALLVDLNVALIEILRAHLMIATPLIRASSLFVAGRRDELVRGICDARGATVYVSAEGSREYLEGGGAFADGAVPIEYQHYVSVEHPQLHGDFMPNLSAVDAIANLGPRARDVMLQGRADREVRP
jgi:hypothetical protein